MKHEKESLDPIGELWLTQPDHTQELDMNRIRSSAEELDRIVGKRNRRERLVAWSLVAFFGTMSVLELVAENFVSASGAALVVASMLWIVFVVRRFGSFSKPGDELGLDSRSFLESYRGALVRQRRLLSLAWLWYCLPIFIGLTLVNFGFAAERGTALGDWALSASSVVTATVFMAVVVLNLVAARGLGARLAELGSGGGDGE